MTCQATCQGYQCTKPKDHEGWHQHPVPGGFESWSNFDSNATADPLRPAHLSWGTHAENMADMMRKRRGRNTA